MLNFLSIIKKSNVIKNFHRTYNMAKLQIISNGYMDSPKSCLLILDKSRYIINCGEGTLRILYNNLRPAQIKNILLTRFDWKTTGGLNGLSKELESVKNSVTLHSNFNFNLDSKDSIKKYFFEKKFQIKQHNYQKSDYTDQNLRIQKIDTGDSCSYLFILNKPEPNILKEKLSSYNIKPGPWIQNLKKGIEHNEDGVVIKPSDILDYSQCYESKILFLDCSSIEEIKKNPVFNQHDMTLIVHMSDSKVLNSDDYLEWIKNYIGKDCIHLFQDEEYPNIDILKLYITQAKLNLIEPELFELLPCQVESFKKIQEEFGTKEKELQKDAKIVQCKTNMVFWLRPKFCLDLTSLNVIDNRAACEKIVDFYDTHLKIKIDGIDEEEQTILNKLSEKIKNYEEKPSVNNYSYPKVLFLGTASSLPGLTRNLSAILLKINPNINILLECGEGTVGQMYKYFYDNTRLWNELVKIKLLYVSHFHLDHFNGLYGLILKRHEAFCKLKIPYEKITILYPKVLNNFLNGNDLIFKNKFFDYVNLVQNDRFLYDKNVNKNLIDLKSLGLNNIHTVYVNHIYNSFGIRLDIVKEDNSVFNLVYSGDCRPTDKLVEMGKNCDLLIHECTFDDTFKDEAKKKSHSTISEALDISERMNAKSTLLTHFSLRYGKITNIDEISRNNVGMAFDFMILTPDNLNKINIILKDIKVAFKENVEDIEYKKAKKLKL